jgi:hypothetical protein
MLYSLNELKSKSIFTVQKSHESLKTQIIKHYRFVIYIL